MVEPTLLAAGAVVFFFILILILRSGVSDDKRKPSKKDKKQQAPQKQKQKRGRSSLKKSERPDEVTEWVGVDTPQKDAQEVLEFLKGKDPSEIAKQHAVATKQANKKKGKKSKEAVLESDESAGESVASDEGFEEVRKKVPADGEKKNKNKKKEKKPEEERKNKSNKPYFKPLSPEEGGPPVEEARKGKRERKAEGAAGGEGADKRARAEGETKERKARPEGERRERKPRPEG